MLDNLYHNLFSNPTALVAVACLLGLVIGVNAMLLAALSNRKGLDRELGVWRKALSGGRDVQREQDAQYAELHQRVANLSKPPSEPSDHPNPPRTTHSGGRSAGPKGNP
jgi:hypothetical protein